MSIVGRAAAAAFVLVAANATVAQACDGIGCGAAPVCEAPQAATDQSAPAMRVNIDPETGQYTASPVLPSQAAAAMKAPSEPPRQQALGGGVYKLDTRGVRHAFVATANPGGLPQTHCIDVRSPQD